MRDTLPRHITYLGISIVQSESQNEISHFKFEIEFSAVHALAAGRFRKCGDMK
jgi:hypothetical protein